MFRKGWEKCELMYSTSNQLPYCYLNTAQRKERNATQKLIIHKTYDLDYAETKEAINSCFDAYEARS
jgi:hypothetical protein